MDLRRRDFLAIFGGILAELATKPGPGATVFENHYINRRLGIAFVQPPEWKFLRLEEMGRMKQGTLLAVDDPKHNADVLDSFDLPFVAMSPTNGENLCVQMYLVGGPGRHDAFQGRFAELCGMQNASALRPDFSGPMRVIREDWQASRGLLKNLRVSPLPSELHLSGCDAAEYTARYDFCHKNLAKPRTISVRSVAVMHRGRYYLLRLIKDQDSDFDFTPFLNSVQFA